MDYLLSHLQPLVLGLVQGITEFLPISSDGHLVIVRDVLGWADQGVLFDAVLHLGSLVAILIYFRQDWAMLLRALTRPSTSPTNRHYRQLAILLAVATVPAILVGLLLTNLIEQDSRQLPIVASLMIFGGLSFIVAERLSVARQSLTKLGFFGSLAFGIAQAAAMLPGVSRSGSTISTGLYLGFKREDAARFSFLMAAPAILLAGGYALWQMLSHPTTPTNWIDLAIGFVLAVVSSLVAIAFMMKFIKRYRLYGFAGYVIIVGLALLGLTFANVQFPLF